MIQRISRKKFRIFAFDLESHNDEESIMKKETSMWLGCFLDEASKIDDEKSYMYKMSDFIERIREESSVKRGKNHNESRPIKNIAIYIYNLSFEWSFILPELLKNGFTFKEKIEDEDEYVFNSITTKSVSSVWLVKIKFSKNSGIVLLKDLAKMFGGGLSRVAESFNLKTQKGEIDYRKNRLHNYKITEQEKEYCYNDTHIIVEILELLKDDKNFWNASSMASYSAKKMIQQGWPRAIKPYAEFRKLYPELEDEETNFLRKGFSGGLTYATRDFQFKLLKKKLIHIDAHQMHPSQGYEHLFPCGKGTFFVGEPKIRSTNINCCRIRVSYYGKLLDSVISLINIPFVDNFEITVWDFEISTMKKCYLGLKIEYIDGYEYRNRRLPWRQFYAKNYYQRLEAKKNKNKFLIKYYKLLNNSSYGKLGEKPHNVIFENYIDEVGIIDSKIHDKEAKDMKINARYTYLPIGSAIPAYSRVDLIETALSFGYENIAYVDTDSIFAIYNEKTKKAWSKVNQVDFLGGWALEEIIDKAQFSAPKRYKTLTKGETTIKAGGINFKSFIAEQAKKLNIDEKDYQMSFDEINILSSKWRVQRAYRVKGGTIIEFQDKEMKILPKYQSIYEKNCEDENIDI